MIVSNRLLFSFFFLFSLHTVNVPFLVEEITETEFCSVLMKYAGWLFLIKVKMNFVSALD